MDVTVFPVTSFFAPNTRFVILHRILDEKDEINITETLEWVKGFFRHQFFVNFSKTIEFFLIKKF